MATDVIARERPYTIYLPGHTLVNPKSELTLCSCGAEGAPGIPVLQKIKWARQHKSQLLNELDDYIRRTRPAPKALPFEGELGQLVVRRYWMYALDAGGDECWAWGGPSTYGYGRISVPGRPPVLAHRVSHMIHHGPIPDGLGVLHSCDNPPCTNPLHLRAGTHAENMQEMLDRHGVWNLGKSLAQCKRGHPMSGDNLLIVGSARGRICRECARWRKKLYRLGGRVK